MAHFETKIDIIKCKICIRHTFFTTVFSTSIGNSKFTLVLLSQKQAPEVHLKICLFELAQPKK